ncbi:MAG: LysM peptidoglycan-binding domain-containing protein, partial [Treponema sp.]|jgi:LysM repeat protein|nr:LysM peptidoglycan-binding domain-containing protein [Treponema sp.]
MVVVTAFAALSCKTVPGPVPAIEGEVTQEKVNDALDQIYDTYRSLLIFEGAQDYTVVAKDTLSDITRRYYGSLTGVGEAGPNNGFYFPLIMMASDSNIVDPDLIEPGMELRIVDLEKNLANPVSRKAIKDSLDGVAYVYNKKGKTATENGLKKLADSL